MDVRYSKRALYNAEEIQTLLMQKFSKKEVDQFHAMLSNFENIIVIFPHLYSASNERPDVRQAVLHKRLTIYYTTMENSIFVLSMKDNIQEKPKDYI